jgi:hypothetical protein
MLFYNLKFGVEGAEYLSSSIFIAFARMLGFYLHFIATFNGLNNTQ